MDEDSRYAAMMKSKQKRKHDIVHRPIVIPKATMDLLLELPVKVRSDSIALYTFYYYTAIWQETNKCYATTNYIKGGDGLEREGLGISKRRIYAAKKALKSIPLIEDIQTRKKGKRRGFGKTYIQILFYHSSEASSHAEEQSCGVSNQSEHRLERAQIRHTNAYSNNSINAYRDNTVVKKTDDSLCLIEGYEDKVKKQDRFYFKRSIQLYNILKSKRKIFRKVDISKWSTQFKELHLKDGIEKSEIKRVLVWYLKHIGEEYMFKAYSASAFRKKFDSIAEKMQEQQH